MHVMGVLEGGIQSTPSIIVPTKCQMWNLNNHLTHLTNHSPNPSFLVRCDVFGRCISFFQLQVRSLFLTLKSNKKVSTGPFQGIHPHSLFKAPDMIFHFPFFQWISHLLTLRLSSKTTTPCSWLVPFLAPGGMVTIVIRNSMGTVKRVENFKAIFVNEMMMEMLREKCKA